MSVLLIWLIMASAFLVSAIIYRKTGKIHSHIIVSGVGTVTMMVLTLIYTYDAYINPNRLDDGRYVSTVMRILAGDDDVRDLTRGIVNGCILIAILLAIFIICLVILQRQKKKAKAEKSGI